MLLSSLLAAYKGTHEDGDGNELFCYDKVWTSFAKDHLSLVFLYAAIVLALLLTTIGLFVYFKRNEVFKRFLTTAIAIACGFTLIVIITLFSLEMMHLYEKDNVVDLLLYPTIALGATVLLGAAAMYICSLFGKKQLTVCAVVSGALALGAFIAVLVCMGKYYNQNIDGDGYYNSSTASVNQIVLYLSAVVLVALVVALGFLFGREDKTGFTSKSIAYAAICVAMSFALSYLKVFELPQGGSITLASLLPLMIYSYLFGTKKGVFAGFLYGLLQAIQDPYIIHPAQFILDYPAAFSAIGLAGTFAKVKKLEKLPQIQFTLGAILASVLRFAAHLLSGVFAFSAYAVDEAYNPLNPWVYSLSYNSFVFVDIAIVIVMGVLIFSSKAFLRQSKKINKQEAN